MFESVYTILQNPRIWINNPGFNDAKNVLIGRFRCQSHVLSYCGGKIDISKPGILNKEI